MFFSLFPFHEALNRKKPRKPESLLPRNDGNIYGRTKEIEDIVQVLSGKSEENTSGVLVSGPAGVGKSTVAIKAGHLLQKRFKDIVKFCSLEGVNKDGALREILNLCVPGRHQGNENPKHVLLNWCRRFRNQRYELVLIVDNADALDDDRSLLKLLSEMRRYSNGKIKFLVTSRRSDIESADAVSDIQFAKIDLGPLDVKESIKVLTNGAPDTDADTLREVAELCENNPLALKLAGPLLAKESEYTPEELKRELEQNAAEALGAKKIMQITFEKLEDSLKHTLVYLSVFPQSFKRDAAEAILGDNCSADLMNLKKRCLIQKQGGRYLIHLLIRSYAKQVGKEKEFCQILSDGKQGFLRHFLSLILNNAKKYWGKDTCKESFILFNEERINLESALREIASQKEIQHCSEMDAVMNECQHVAPYIEYCVHFKLYEEFLRGLLSRSQGEITKQVEILCLLYHEKRKYSCNYKQKSEDLILKAQELHDKNPSLFDQERLSKACYLNHYGRYLSEDRNERKQAQPLLKQAISIYEERDSSFDIGRIYVQMGHNLKHGERCEEALNSYTEALRFRSSYYGKHILTAFAHKDVADYHFRLENFLKAEESYNEAIQLLKDIEMDRQKEAVSVYRNYGKCCEKRGKIKEARKVLEMGRDIAADTIKGSVRVKVEVNTALAVLLYKKYPEEANRANRLCSEVFKMSKELEMDKWPESTELHTFCKRNDTCG